MELSESPTHPGTSTSLLKIWTVLSKMGPLLALCILFLLPIGCFSQTCSAVNLSPAIREDEKPGTVVTALIIDPDLTPEVTTPKFGINGSNLVLTEEVDYEEEQLIRVTLICKRNTQTVSVHTIYVQIINVNDNPPVFKSANYSFTILENQQVGSTINPAIEAEDADQDTLYYELIGNDMNAAAYFRLASVTNPFLVVNKPLDYDLYPHIQLNLTARDSEIPGDSSNHTATTLLIIDILDADDKSPFFQPCRKIGTKICITDGYRSSVNRSELAAQPLQLTPGPLYAVDGDYGINDPISYSIISGDTYNIFAIHDTNGNITMNKPVDTLGTILLQVMAFQTNDMLKYSTTTVQIEVKEKNNFPPRFQKFNYYGTIPSNTEIGSFVLDSSDQTKQLQVFAADADFSDEFNAAVTYRIENSTDFSVLRDGYILTNTAFTSPGTIVLLVNATDPTTSESTTTIVTIEITPALTTATTISTTTNTAWTGTTTTPRPGPSSTVNIITMTGSTTSTTPSTQTTTSTTTGTGTTTTTTPSTRTTLSTTTGTGTTTTTTPSTQTTTSTTTGTGSTTTTTPSTQTTASTTTGTGTTTTTTPSTQTTTSTTTGTGTTTTTTPSTQTTTSTTTGTGTTTTTTPSTRTTTSTTTETGSTTTTAPSTQTTTSTTIGTGTTTTTTPSTRTTTSTTTGTGTTTTTTPSTRTTTSTTTRTGSTTTTAPSTQTTTSTTTGTGTTTTTTPSTRTTTSTTTGTGTTTTPSTYTTSTTSGTGTTTRSSTTDTGITSTKNPEPGGIGGELQKGIYTVADMTMLGAILGAVLALCLVGLAFLIYKQYGNTIRSRLTRGSGNNSGGSEDRTERLINDDDNLNITMPSHLESGIHGEINVVSSENNLLSAAAVSTVVLINAPTESQRLEEADGEYDSEDKKVKSILTKDLKEDGGYKSVWFREDAAPEVMVIEGVEHGDTNDDGTEELSNQNEDDNDNDDDDEDELDPTFNITNNDSHNFSIL